jgi:pimeloyl-ACP methyl ester carboxylesterase
VPVPAVGGEISTSGTLVAEMMRDADVRGVRVPGTAHWVPEERPEAFVRAVLDLVGEAAGPGPMVFGP